MEVANRGIETTDFGCHVAFDRLNILRIVAIMRAESSTVGDGTGCIAVFLLGNLTERQGGHLLRVHFPGLGERLMSESLTGMREACLLLEILLRRSCTGDRLLEIHLEFRHDELLVWLGSCSGISATVVREVTLHVRRLLLRYVVQARRVHLIRLVVGRREVA